MSDQFSNFFNSYANSVSLLAEKPTKLEREAVLNWFGGKQGYLELHEQWVSDADLSRTITIK